MSTKANKEIVAMQAAHEALAGLKNDEQIRVLAWLTQKFGVSHTSTTQANNANAQFSTAQAGPAGQSGQTPSARTFMTQKKPADFQERIACLAYYLTHHKHTATFKTRDITKMNSDAGQSNLSNPAVFVNNALKCQYLSSAGGGRKQITPRGEAVVGALPHREAVKQALSDHPLAGRRGKTTKKKKKVKA